MPPTVAQTAPAFADAAAEASAGFLLTANAACRAECEDRSVRLPPLPPVAQNFVEELLAGRLSEGRGPFPQLDDDSTRRVLLPAAPSVFEDWAWSKDYSPPGVKPFDAEPLDFVRPIVTLLVYEESDWPRRLDWFYAPPMAEQDLPSLPPNVPLAFDDAMNSFLGSAGSLAALVLLDEFVNAPSGGGAFGPAPRGRSVRFGFSISSFR